jgi:hypothetical protein
MIHIPHLIEQLRDAVKVTAVAIGESIRWLITFILYELNPWA